MAVQTWVRSFSFRSSQKPKLAKGKSGWTTCWAEDGVAETILPPSICHLSPRLAFFCTLLKTPVFIDDSHDFGIFKSWKRKQVKTPFRFLLVSSLKSRSVFGLWPLAFAHQQVNAHDHTGPRPVPSPRFPPSTPRKREWKREGASRARSKPVLPLQRPCLRCSMFPASGIPIPL